MSEDYSAEGRDRIAPVTYQHTTIENLMAYYAITGRATILDGDARARSGRL